MLHAKCEVGGTVHIISRSCVYSQVLSLYKEDAGVTNEYPLRINFMDERAVDLGGVCRDLFAAFWEVAYQRLFEGASQLTPVLHAQTDIGIFPVLGHVVSHGYLVCGYLPVQIALPCLLAMFLEAGGISNSMLMDAFCNSISPVEASFLKGCFRITSSAFSSGVQAKLISLLSRFGSREVPTPTTLKLCKYEFLVKPMAALSMIKGGIPLAHRPFWNRFSIDEFHALYKTLTASPSKVLDMLIEPDMANSSQERVFSYLQQYIGNMRFEEIQRFLRFVSGSSVCSSSDITVAFLCRDWVGDHLRQYSCIP